MKKLLFISTNYVWSGSEELWSRCAIEIKRQNLANVAVATRYYHKSLQGFTDNYLNYSVRQSESLLAKITRLTKISDFRKDRLRLFILKNKPDAVIISQGNNIESLEIMNLCLELKLPYVTITQLVSDFHFLYIADENLASLQNAYTNARRNFFVSLNNLDLHNLMIGRSLSNSEVINNPNKLSSFENIKFPTHELFSFGLVGRIECFHKGYDLLLQVIRQEKWQERNCLFNIYGDGPHLSLLQQNVIRLGIKNMKFKGFTSAINEIWSENKILLMPSRMEGQALALIEAMFCGRTAIVTEVGGASELISHGVNGFLAESATVKALENAMETAWLSRNSWETMGKLCSTKIKSAYHEDPVERLSSKIISYLFT